MDWAETIVAALREAGVRLLTVVPDEMLIPLIARARADEGFTTVIATREEEAFGIASGAFLGGTRAALLMQSSGFGNSVNALASLVTPYQLPIPFFISERGVLGEFNAVQVPMSRVLRPALDALGIPHVTLARADELAFLTSRTLAQCYRTNLPAALILSPQLTGGKTDRVGARPAERSAR
ncbi:MAG: thiamine pyrophosphate-binding protein [Thermomicrobiales bacterium]